MTKMGEGSSRQFRFLSEEYIFNIYKKKLYLRTIGVRIVVFFASINYAVLSTYIFLKIKVVMLDAKKKKVVVLVSGVRFTSISTC